MTTIYSRFIASKRLHAGISRVRSVVEMRAMGMTFEEIGQRLGVGKARAGQIFQQAGIKDPARLRCAVCCAGVTHRPGWYRGQGPHLCHGCKASEVTRVRRYEERTRWESEEC